MMENHVPNNQDKKLNHFAVMLMIGFNMSKKERSRRAERNVEKIQIPIEKVKQKWYQHLIQTGETNQLNEGMGLGLAAGAAALAIPYLAKKYLKPKADKALQRRNETPS